MRGYTFTNGKLEQQGEVSAFEDFILLQKFFGRINETLETMAVKSVSPNKMAKLEGTANDATIEFTEEEVNCDISRHAMYIVIHYILDKYHTEDNLDGYTQLLITANKEEYKKGEENE